MNRPYFEQLKSLLDAADLTGRDSGLRLEGEAIVFDSRPSGILAHLLLLTVWLGIPVWLVLSEPGWFEWVIAAGWLLVFGRTIWSIVSIDSEARLEVRDRRVALSNINPLLGWFRRMHGLRFGWEGEYAWSEVESLRVENRIHTKSQESNVIVLVTFDGRKLPVAAYQKVNIAHGVAAILRAMLGLQSSPPQQ